MQKKALKSSSRVYQGQAVYNMFFWAKTHPYDLLHASTCIEMNIMLVTGPL